MDLPAARAEGETGEETAAAEEEEDSEAARAGGDSVAAATAAVDSGAEDWVVGWVVVLEVGLGEGQE